MPKFRVGDQVRVKMNRGNLALYDESLAGEILTISEIQRGNAEFAITYHTEQTYGYYWDEGAFEPISEIEALIRLEDSMEDNLLLKRRK